MITEATPRMREVAKMSDEAIVDLINETKEVAYFSFIYERYSRKILKTCMNFIKDRQRAEDAMQDIFLRVLNYLEAFSHKAKFSTWLYTVTRNYCIDYIKAEKRRYAVSLESQYHLSEEPKEVTPNKTQSPFFKIESLIKVMDHIRPDEKEMILLKYIDNCSIKQIMSTYNLSESATKMRIKRAKEKVKNIYHKNYQEAI